MPTPSNPRPVRGVRFPLSAKILLWFFLNLAFVGAAGWVFARGQLRLGLDSLLAGPVNERLQKLGAELADELNRRPESEWEQIVVKAGAPYHVQMAMFLNDGRALTGGMNLPVEVRERLFDRARQKANAPSEANTPPLDNPDAATGKAALPAP